MTDSLADAKLIDAVVTLTDEPDDLRHDGRALSAEKAVRKEYGDVQQVTLRIPLFVLTAPNVEGCKTTLTRSTSVAAGWSLTLKFFGNGASLGQKATVSWTQEVSAGPGERSRLFLPLQVDVAEVTTYFDDHEEQVSYEVQLGKENLTVNKIGVDSPHEWEPTGLKVPLIESLLKESPEPVTQEVEYKFQTDGDFSLGFKAFSNDQTFKVEASLERTHKLAAELAAGHDYVGSAGAGPWPPYLAWSVDGRPDGPRGT
ncbi:hypothetical protein [Nocardioides sp. URHA0020]|uniref:hypothetical protein n=1 Tax=Nocardioides sp. URHA0020 TaxID=1380392 RepID=UPI00048EC9CA|nr:hypothetical protein [Nocardioides sp. URHA0020]